MLAARVQLITALSNMVPWYYILLNTLMTSDETKRCNYMNDIFKFVCVNISRRCFEKRVRWNLVLSGKKIDCELKGFGILFSHKGPIYCFCRRIQRLYVPAILTQKYIHILIYQNKLIEINICRIIAVTQLMFLPFNVTNTKKLLSYCLTLY